MSDQEKQLERRPQVSPTISAWRRYLQPLVGGALVFLVVLVVDIIVHFLVAQALHIHYEVSLGPIHSAAASVSALVAGAGAALVEDRVLDKTANAPMWLAGCVLASILYLVLDILLLNML